MWIITFAPHPMQSTATVKTSPSQGHPIALPSPTSRVSSPECVHSHRTSLPSLPISLLPMHAFTSPRPRLVLPATNLAAEAPPRHHHPHRRCPHALASQSFPLIAITTPRVAHMLPFTHHRSSSVSKLCPTTLAWRPRLQCGPPPSKNTSALIS